MSNRRRWANLRSRRALWGAVVAVVAVALAGTAGLATAAAHDLERHEPKGAEAEARLITDEGDGIRFEVPRAGTYRLPVIKPAADGVVLGTDGGVRRLLEVMGGRVVLLSFIYTRCSDEKGCPLATATFLDIEDAMTRQPKLAGALRLVSLSFDPAHDTPAAMAAYAGEGPKGGAPSTPAWSFLTTTSKAALDPILAGYGQYVAPEVDGNGAPTGLFNHLLKVFLIDRQGRVRNIYSAAFLYPELVITDVKTLLLEETGLMEETGGEN